MKIVVCVPRKEGRTQLKWEEMSRDTSSGYDEADRAKCDKAWCVQKVLRFIL